MTVRRGPILPVSASTGLSQDVDESSNDRSGYCVRLPSSSHGDPRAILGRQIAENNVLRGYLLQRLADHCNAQPRRYKSERARGSVRFVDDLRLESYAPTNFQEPITVIRVHAI